MSINNNLFHIRGVLFRCTIRGGHASLAIIVTHDDSVSSHQQANERMVLVVVRLGGSDWGTTKLDDNTKSIHNRKVVQDNHDMMMSLRSNIKRLCKLGNELEFYGHYAEQTDVLRTEATTNDTNTSASTDWNNWTRFIVDYHLPSTTTNSSEAKSRNVRIYQALKWNPIQCQQTRLRYFGSPPKKQHQKKKKNAKDDKEQSKSRHSGGGIGKRKQGEIVANFLLWMLSNHNDTDKRCSDNDATTDMSTNDDAQHHLFMQRWVPLHPSLEEKQSKTYNTPTTKRKTCTTTQVSDTETADSDDTMRKSNSKLNILDAAGGAGHVSLALALRGVHSCVVDPRKTVGKLPGRDRKALKKNQASFSAYRAWFGSRPKGVDSFYREGSSANSNGTSSTLEDPLSLPICSMCSEDNLLSTCNAIVALHPDEATGVIVETAVENEIPFVVVPCCVFSRLFPKRIKPLGKEGENNIVSTYFELIDWLVDKHPAIKVTRLPFDGANIAVWATFDNETT